jgi:arylsulfatase A-like enzyme
MITAMDDQIGRVVEALEQRGMRDDTLIVFQSDNGGPRDARFTGEVDMSKSTIPADNGPYRDGKASVYEGGTRVAALANWPARIKAGSTVDSPIHLVDMFPTIAALAGASTAKSKGLDGLDVWAAIGEGKTSPRTEVVYDIEPFRGAMRVGTWKLIWQATLPQRLELYDLATDPGEKTNVAAAHPEKVADLQKRIEAQARGGVQPLIMKEAFGALMHSLFGSVALPADVKAVVDVP